MNFLQWKGVGDVSKHLVLPVLFSYCISHFFLLEKYNEMKSIFPMFRLALQPQEEGSAAVGVRGESGGRDSLL